MAATAWPLVFIGAVALSVLPLKAQIVVLLAALAYGWTLLTKEHAAELVSPDRIIDVATATKSASDDTKYSERFTDAKQAIDIIARACGKFDSSKAGLLASALDECAEQYIRVLSGESSAYTTHMQARYKADDILQECYVACDEAATKDIDEAGALLSSLFEAYDIVMHRDGKADRPWGANPQ